MTDLQTRLSACGRGVRAKIARACGISPHAVYQWKAVPGGHVLTVEGVTGIPRHEIRPDIYPDPAPNGVRDEVAA